MSGPERSNTPDWGALADASARRQRRRKWTLIGSGALAAGLVGAIVTTAVLRDSGGTGNTGNTASQLPGPSSLPSYNNQAQPSFEATAAAPPLDPEDFIASAGKDTAPLTPESLYPGAKLTMGGRAYAKGTVAAATNCANATQGGLGAVLTANGCTQLIRATYTSGNVAVTVGVAVFKTEAEATRTKAEFKEGNITSLSGSNVKTFCRTTICRKTGNARGRYAYFTISGFLDGKNVVETDKAVFQAGDDLAEFTFRQIVARGRAAASAAAATGGGVVAG
jgi:hypothetical protein